MPFVCQKDSRTDGGWWSCSAAAEQVRINGPVAGQEQGARLVTFNNISKLLMSKMCPQNLNVGIRFHVLYFVIF